MNKVDIRDLLEWAYIKGMQYEHMKAAHESASERAFKAERELSVADLPKKKESKS